VHGFGFADVLKEQLQFAGSNLLVSLLSFNVGIEIGQLAVLCVFVPALALLFRGRMAGRMGIIVLSAIIANIAWQWMVQRGEVHWKTPWPQLTVPGLMILARWTVALSLAVVVAKLLAKWIEHKWPGHVLPAESRIEGVTRSTDGSPGMKAPGTGEIVELAPGKIPLPGRRGICALTC
jgi:hypothetical protein